MQGVLQAVTMGNMFRDMSGLAQTSQLAQAALNAAAQGASHASTQAGSNMATAGQFYTEMAKVGLDAAKLAASMAPMLASMPPIPISGGSSIGSSSITNAGAALNAVNKLNGNPLGNINSSGNGDIKSLISGGGSANGSVQRMLDKITGTSSGASPNNIVPLGSGYLVPKESFIRNYEDSYQEKTKAILERAAQNEDGSPNEGDMNKIEGILREEFEKNLKPSISANSSNYENLKEPLRNLLKWMSDIQHAGLTDNLSKEYQEGLELAKQAMYSSLNNALDRAKNDNDPKQIKVAITICADAALMGFRNDIPAFDPNLVITNLNLSLDLKTEFDSGIKDGETRPLRVTALLKIGNNTEVPFGFEVHIQITGGRLIPFDSGNTNEYGNFTVEIDCEQRANLKISVTAGDGTLEELVKRIDVPL